jgi:predicted regulator of Ras-like GTPase activity (Roadblock/LC7/MglB family)
MATIKKTFVTRLDNVMIFPEGMRAAVSLIDSEDDKNVTAHLMVVVKDGKVVQPPVALDVDPAVASAAATILSAFGKLVDTVLTSQPIFIRGSVPPTSPPRPQQ